LVVKKEKRKREKEKKMADGPKDRLKGLVGRKLKVEISDGRVMVGTFLCVDQWKNFVLGGCEESRGGSFIFFFILLLFFYFYFNF